MKVAIDVDGTLTAYPEVVADLVDALSRTGNSVMFLTGNASPDPYKVDRDEVRRLRREQVQSLARVSDPVIHVCFVRNSKEAAIEKAEYCYANGIALFIDDAPDYCEAVKAKCPAAMVLHVRENK